MKNQKDVGSVVRYCAKCYATMLESENICPKCFCRGIKEITISNSGAEVEPSIDLCRAGQRFDAIYSK